MFEFAISVLILSIAGWVLSGLVCHTLEWYWDNFS